MSNVIPFPLRAPVGEVLAGARDAGLRSVVVLGERQDGSRYEDAAGIDCVVLCRMLAEVQQEIVVALAARDDDRAG